jgi:hypothetical protein
MLKMSIRKSEFGLVKMGEKKKFGKSGEIFQKLRMDG